MRGALPITLNGREYMLLPSFGVVANFEDRHGSIAQHLASLLSLTATMQVRSFLLLQALQAWRNDNPQPSAQMTFTQDAVAKALFEGGLWHDDTVAAEISLVEALLYTPEQYQAKKDQRAAARKAQGEMMDSLGALSSFSESLSQT